MAFYETQFPTGISNGATGGPGFNTTVVSFPSGVEQRNSNWSLSRAAYDVSHTIKKQYQLDSLIAFFRTMQGKAHGFRFKDWSDYTVDFTTGVLGSGAGSGVPTYQLVKQYVSAATNLRNINKPVAGTVSATRGGTALVFGGSPGNIAIDTTTGLITFIADASSAASSITVGATTQVVLGANPGSLAVGQRLYLTGFTGTDAALVNALAHTITAVSGSTFTLSTVTTGKTITVGSGAGYKYPQISELLAWSGEFDVPCRFDTDQLQATIVSYGVFNWGNVPIVELQQ